MRIQLLIFFTVFVLIFFSLHITTLAVFVRALELPHEGVIIGSLLASIFLVLGYRAPRLSDNTFTSALYIAASTWLGVLFLFFSSTMVYEVIRLLLGSDNTPLYIGIQSVTLLAAIYALWNATRLTTKTHTIPFSGIDTAVRVVHLSDIHVGSVHRERFLSRVVQETNAFNPDLVLISGDLFDGSVPVHAEMLAPLDQLSAPAYLSHGNHEVYEGLSLVSDTIKPLKLTLLDNKVATWKLSLIHI